jgi:hypothetical protein
MFSITRRKLPTTKGAYVSCCGGAIQGVCRLTEHDNHEVPKTEETRRRGGVMAEARRPRLRMDSSHMAILPLQRLPQLAGRVSVAVGFAGVR